MLYNTTTAKSLTEPELTPYSSWGIYLLEIFNPPKLLKPVQMTALTI